MIFILIIFITTPVSPKLEGWQGFFDDQYGNVNQKKDEIISEIAFCFLFPKKMFIQMFSTKVQIFWEGLKSLKQSPTFFWRLLKQFPNKVGDFFKLCGLLTISELYHRFDVS